MISHLVLIIGIVIWGYVLTSLLKIKEGFGPVLGIAVSMAVLEIGGALGILWLAAISYCIAVCIFSIAYVACTRDKGKLKSYFLNPSIIGFLFAALFYIILSAGKILFYTECDAFLHWGMFSKAAFYHHNLDIWHNDLWVNHSTYPHGMASWYSLFSLGKEIYTERDVMISINVLLFASCCPIVDIAVSKMKKLLSGKKIISLLCYLVSGMSVASFLWIWKFDEGVWAYTSAIMDIPLGAVFMVALCLTLADCESNYGKAFGVSLLSAMLVMIKPSGIIFAVTVSAVYMINEYMSKDIHLTFGDMRRLLCGGGVECFGSVDGIWYLDCRDKISWQGGVGSI